MIEVNGRFGNNPCLSSKITGHGIMLLRNVLCTYIYPCPICDNTLTCASACFSNHATWLCFCIFPYNTPCHDQKLSLGWSNFHSFGPRLFRQTLIRNKSERIYYAKKQSTRFTRCSFFQKITIWRTAMVSISGWWFGIFGLFSHILSYIGNNPANWLWYVSEGFKPPSRNYRINSESSSL